MALPAWRGRFRAESVHQALLAIHRNTRPACGGMPDSLNPQSWALPEGQTHHSPGRMPGTVAQVVCPYPPPRKLRCLRVARASPRPSAGPRLPSPLRYVATRGTGPRDRSPAVPGRGRAKGCVQEANIESFRLMILPMRSRPLHCAGPGTGPRDLPSLPAWRELCRLRSGKGSR